MNRESKIFVAGGTGMVGSAILRRLAASGYSRVVASCHAKEPSGEDASGAAFSRLDLTRQSEVEAFFSRERPEHVFLAAAKVGGIHANNASPADFISINLIIQCNVIHAAFSSGVKRLLFLGSSCIYPKFAPQPMREEDLLSSPLEPTNEPYALAKIAGIKMCESYNRQYGTRFLSVMPTNLYGPRDNFDLETSHVVPALIRKVCEAQKAHSAEVAIWGTGNPRREFLHVDDAADACHFVMTLPDEVISKEFLAYPQPSFANVGTGEDITIRELAELVCASAGYKGRLQYDTSKPDGTPRKLLDVEKMRRLGWSPKISLREGIRLTYEWYVRQVEG